MAIITAADALALTVTREQQFEKIIQPWREVFNTKVRNAAQGSRSEEGKTWMFYEISAASELMKSALDVFLHEIRAAKYDIRLNDQDDDGDYFRYRVSWEAK
jgi:hypothetical protein